MENKISIIIPIYNSEKWLEECIESVIQQSYKNLDIILVDDGSTDKSAIICDEYAKKDNRIQVIHKQNEGVSIARNIGIKQAKGKYIKFVDSDDWLEKDCCEKLIHIMEEKRVDLVICGLNIFRNKQLLRNPHLEEKQLKIKDSIENFKYISKVFASPCNKLYKKEKIKELFKEDLELGEDLFFNLKYLENIDTISITEKCLYNVRLDNNNSLNRKFSDDKLDINFNLLDEQLKFCNKLYGNNANVNFLYKSYILLLHAYILQIMDVYDKNKVKETIRKYINDKRIEKACDTSKLDRFDYRIFEQLVKRKKVMMIYNFIKLKKILMEEKNDKK